MQITTVVTGRDGEKGLTISLGPASPYFLRGREGDLVLPPGMATREVAVRYFEQLLQRAGVPSQSELVQQRQASQPAD